MGLDLSIERDGAEIALEDWQAAVAATPGVEWHPEDRVTRNPATGAEIRIPARPWQARAGQAMLFWRTKAIDTAVPWDFSQRRDSAEWKGIFALARQLGARVVANFEVELLEDGTQRDLS